MAFPVRAGGTSRTEVASIDLLEDGSSFVGGMFFGTANFGDTINLSSSNDADGFSAKLNADGSFAWATKVGGTSSVQVRDIAALANGSSIITGYWSGTATFGGDSYTSDPTHLNDVFIAKLDASGNYDWIQSAGGTKSDEPAAVTLLDNGSSLITGSFSGTATFGATELVSTNNNREIFIAKLNASGGYDWAIKAGGSGNDHARDIIVLSDGSSIITGDFDGGTSFETSNGTINLNDPGSSSAFIAKLNSSRTFDWVIKAGEPDSGSDSVYSYGIDVLSDGSYLITGKFKGSVEFGGPSISLTSDGSSDDIFVAKIGSDGAFVWAKQAGGSSAERGQSVTALSDGSALITGRFQGTADFGNGITLTSSGGEDAFVAKIDENGNFLWAKSAGGTSSDYGTKIAARSNEDSVITGDFKDTATFGSSDLSSPGNSDIFVAPLDTNGKWLSSLVLLPSVTSATYDSSTGVLTIAGENIPSNSGVNNDIDVSKLTITGQDGVGYTLTSNNVEISSSTEFSITLNGADVLGLAALINKDGTSSFGGTTYNIEAAEDWAQGAASSDNIADLTGNSLTATNTSNQLQAVPTSTTAYDVDGDSSSPTGEEVDKGFDGDIYTKYLNFGKTNSGVEFVFNTAHKLTGFEIYTANDGSERDPASYTLLGSADGGATFSTLATGNLSLPDTRRTAGGYVNLSSSSYFSTYRIIFPEVKNSGGNSMQLAELMLFGIGNNAPNLSNVSSGSIEEDNDSSNTTTSDLSGTLSATDADTGDTLTYGISGGSIDNGVSTLISAYGSLSVNTTTGDYAYTPNSSSLETLCVGTISDSFTVSATDGKDTTTVPYVVSITGADDSANISGDSSGSAAEDTAITGSLTATDVEGLTDGSYFSIETGDGPANGSAAIDPASGTWSYTPVANFNGNDQFSVTVTDDCSGTTTQSITLSINSVDDPATVGGDISGSTEEDSSVISGNLSATDVEGLSDGSYFSIETEDRPTNGSASIDQASGDWSYTPDADFNGSDSFNVTITDDLGGITTQSIALTIAAVKDTWNFSNDYLEEQTAADLDANGVIGDGTPGNATAPANLSSSTYAAGDDYLVEGTLASTAALDAVQSFFSTFNTSQGIIFDATSSYKYTNLSGTAANLKTLSSTDLGNVSGTLTVSDSFTAPTALSDLQAIKASFSGSTFTYYGIQGTTKELADSRNDSGFDWIKSITAQNGTKSFTLTDLSLNSTHLSALIGTGSDALDASYLITQNGLTSNSTAYVGSIGGGGGFAYSSDAAPDATTSYLVPVTSSNSPYTNHVIGLANTATPNPSTFADFNVTDDDAASGLSLTTHFYGGEQLSHISLSGADLSTTNGYSYQQTAGSGTSSVADDIWTLSLNLTPGQPAISGSVTDNSGSSILGLILHTIGSSDVGSSNDLGASVFRTEAWWNDISAQDPNYKFSDSCPGININGSNGNAIDFDFYLSKDYLERAFSVDFDAIQGGFAASGLSSVSSANESTGTYIDVSKSGAISSLKLPVTISDVSSTTAGGSTNLYQVAFSNSSWSKGNLSLVYGPSVASTITGDISGSGDEDGAPITGSLSATDPQGLTDGTIYSIESGDEPSNGSATIDPASGDWSYTPTANFNGIDSFTVTVTDDLGGTTTQQIDLTITAVDDQATISGDTSGSITEDSSTTAVTGSISISDVDSGDSPSFPDVGATTSDNGYGSFLLNSGTWVYTLDNDNNTVNALNDGDTLTDSFILTATDTSTQSITITITGTTDPTPSPSPQPTPTPAPEPTPDPTPADTAPLATDVQLSDNDGDGLKEVITAADGALIDGNGDGIADAEQSDVVGLRMINDGAENTDYGALETDPDLAFSAVSFLIPTEPLTETYAVTTRDGQPQTTSIPSGIDNAFAGLLGFTVSGLSNGGSTSTTISLPQGLKNLNPAQLAYLRFNYATNRFEDYINTSGSPLYSFQDSTGDGQIDSVVLQLIDGDAAWDGDGIANGSVIDPGFVATADRKLSGNRKDNTLRGNVLANTLLGKNGSDTLIGDLGNDTLIGNGKHDRLRGGEGDDKLKGKTGDDRLNGGDHDDQLDGGKGDDILIGGSGADRFRLSKGSDTIKDFSIADDDQLLIRNATNLTIDQLDKNLLLIDTDQDISTTLKGVALDDLLAHQPELFG